MQRIIALLALLCFGGSVLADCRTHRPVAHHQRAYVAPYAEPAKVIVIYSASYVPDGETALKALLAEVKGLRADVATYRDAPAKEPRASKGDVTKIRADALAIYVAKCAACHTADVAEKKGGKFVLLDAGKRVGLSSEQSDDLLARLESDGKDRMPRSTKAKKTPPLTEAEIDAVEADLISQGKP